MAIAVHGSRSLDTTEADTVYVYAGGLVRARGGRVFVGTGGACIGSHGARVSLVADGLAALTDEPAPRAVLEDCEAFVEAGEAHVAGEGSYRVTGTGRVWAADTVPGEVLEGRLAEVRRWAPADAAAVGHNLEAAFAAADGPDRATLAPEPEGGLAAWARPLVDALTAHGARHRRDTDERGGLRVELTASAPVQVLTDTLADLALPPSFTVGQRDGAVQIASVHGLHCEITRRRWLG